MNQNRRTGTVFTRSWLFLYLSVPPLWSYPIRRVKSRVCFTSPLLLCCVLLPRFECAKGVKSKRGNESAHRLPLGEEVFNQLISKCRALSEQRTLCRNFACRGSRGSSEKRGFKEGLFFPTGCDTVSGESEFFFWVLENLVLYSEFFSSHYCNVCSTKNVSHKETYKTAVEDSNR